MVMMSQKLLKKSFKSDHNMVVQFDIFKENNNDLMPPIEFDVDTLSQCIATNIKKKGFWKINIIFVNASTIKKLNKEFRAQDKETDVLSFNIDDNLGEVYICTSFIKNNLPVKTSLEEEILRMIIHGFLHILGFEHENYFDSTAGDKEEMFELQEKILHDILNNLK
jgi:probable rRNA maturation factor